MVVEIGRGELYFLAGLLQNDIFQQEEKLLKEQSHSGRDYLKQHIQEHKILVGKLLEAINTGGKSVIIVNEKQQ